MPPKLIAPAAPSRRVGWPALFLLRLRLDFYPSHIVHPMSEPRKRSDWSRSLPRPLKIPGVMDHLKTLADVRTLLGHLSKEMRATYTWQYIKAELKKAAAGGDTTQVWIALQMVLMLENFECWPAYENGPEG